jgi:hypothetical protein
MLFLLAILRLAASDGEAEAAPQNDGDIPADKPPQNDDPHRRHGHDDPDLVALRERQRALAERRRELHRSLRAAQEKGLGRDGELQEMEEQLKKEELAVREEHRKLRGGGFPIPGNEFPNRGHDPRERLQQRLKALQEKGLDESDPEISKIREHLRKFEEKAKEPFQRAHERANQPRKRSNPGEGGRKQKESSSGFSWFGNCVILVLFAVIGFFAYRFVTARMKKRKPSDRLPSAFGRGSGRN